MSPSRSKSLALFICGSLTPNLHENYGDYTQVYTAFFRSALPKRLDFTFDSYDVVRKMEYPSEDLLDSYDGIVLTGSGN